jgi:hypothetical protein
MKHRFLILIGLAMGLALFAQQGPGGPPPGGQPPMRMGYDSSKETTLTGTVSAVTTETRGRGAFVILGFLADGKSYQVLAGPESLLRQSAVSFAQDDALTVVGVAQDGPRGATLFLARTITKGDVVLTLLDADGRPVRAPA